MKAPRRETYPNRTVKLLGYCFSWESRLVQVDEPRTGQHPKYRRDECQNDEQEESHEEQVRVVAEKPAPLSSPMRWGMHGGHHSESHSAWQACFSPAACPRAAAVFVLVAAFFPLLHWTCARKIQEVHGEPRPPTLDA